MVQWVVGSILHGGPIEPVLHNCCNKGRGMCYPVFGGGAYKIPLAVNRKE